MRRLVGEVGRDDWWDDVLRALNVNVGIHRIRMSVSEAVCWWWERDPKTDRPVGCLEWDLSALAAGTGPVVVCWPD